MRFLFLLILMVSFSLPTFAQEGVATWETMTLEQLKDVKTKGLSRVDKKRLKKLISVKKKEKRAEEKRLKELAKQQKKEQKIIQEAYDETTVNRDEFSSHVTIKSANPYAGLFDWRPNSFIRAIPQDDGSVYYQIISNLRYNGPILYYHSATLAGGMKMEFHLFKRYREKCYEKDKMKCQVVELVGMTLPESVIRGAIAKNQAIRFRIESRGADSYKLEIPPPFLKGFMKKVDEVTAESD